MEPTNNRAALILGFLGDDVADDVLSRMKPESAERLRRQRAEPSALFGNRRLRTTVLEDFQRYLRFVEQQTIPKLHVPSDESALQSTPPSARRSRAATSVAAIDPEGNPAEGLEQVTEFQVAAALEQEPPKAAALLLSVLPPRRSAEILAHLPSAIRDKVVPELGREQVANPAVLERLLRTVLRRAMTVPPEGVERIDRVQRLADVLRAVARPQRKQMMETLQEHDAESAAAVLDKLYVFDDLKYCNDRLVQRVLTEIDGTTLATALGNADEEIRQKVFSNLSRRAAVSLKEELEFQKNFPAAQVDAAKAEIAKALARVDQEGE